MDARRKSNRNKQTLKKNSENMGKILTKTPGTGATKGGSPKAANHGEQPATDSKEITRLFNELKAGGMLFSQRSTGLEEAIYELQRVAKDYSYIAEGLRTDLDECRLQTLHAWAAHYLAVIHTIATETPQLVCLLAEKLHDATLADVEQYAATLEQLRQRLNF